MSKVISSSLYGQRRIILKWKSETECLKELEEYDYKHNAGYVETLQSYLKHNGSMSGGGRVVYASDTVLYRIGNIKKILNNELKTPDERLPYQIAFLYQKYAVRMQ